MNAREYDLLTAAPSRHGDRKEPPAPGAGSVGIRRVHQLRAIARAPALVRKLYVAIVALPRTGPRRYDAAMFTTLIGLTLVVAQPPQPLAVPPALPKDPNPESRWPPLGCLQMFPTHAWCVAQEEAAGAFLARCDRVLLSLEGNGDGNQRAEWETLRNGASQSCALWHALAEAQDEANPISEGERRARLAVLLRVLPKDFHAGRMPPPIPDDAPRD
jgi:hypothetical protein